MYATKVILTYLHTHFSSLKPNGYSIYHLLYHTKLWILPAERIFVFQIILTINSAIVSLNRINWSTFAAET